LCSLGAREWCSSERTGADGGHGCEELTQQQLLAEDLLDVLLALHRETLQPPAARRRRRRRRRRGERSFKKAF